MEKDLSTGLSELDELLHGLIVGDNIVWQVETVDDYRKHYPFGPSIVDQGIHRRPDGPSCRIRPRADRR